MPHRSKQEALLRLNIGFARIAARQGVPPEDCLLALKSHLASIKALEESCNSPLRGPEMDARVAVCK